MRKKVFLFALIQLLTVCVFAGVPGRYVKIVLTGKKILSLAEVQVFSNGKNVARGKKAIQSTTEFDGVAAKAVDGNTNGDFFKHSVTHTLTNGSNPSWEVDLKVPVMIDKIVVWNRTDTAPERIKGALVLILDSNRNIVWANRITKTVNKTILNMTEKPIEKYIGKKCKSMVLKKEEKKLAENKTNKK